MAHRIFAVFFSLLVCRLLIGERCLSCMFSYVAVLYINKTFFGFFNYYIILVNTMFFV